MSSTPPGTPKPASKWASRMGAAMRRSSTILSVARPSTPSEPDSDSKSLRRSISREVPIPPTVLSPPPQPASIPTPIAESPAREAAAMQQEVVGPSPLAQKTAEAAHAEVATPEPIAAQVADADEATSPVGYVPPPVIDSSVGNPGAFTDLLEELPQPSEVQDPYAASTTGPPAPEPEPAVVSEVVPVAEEAAAPPVENVPLPVIDSSAGDPGAYVDELDVLPQPVQAQEPLAEPATEAAAGNSHAIEMQQEPEAPVERVVEAPVIEHSNSYFDRPMAESMSDFDPNQQTEFIESVAENTAIAPEHEPVPVTVEGHQQEEPNYEHGEAASYFRGDPAMPVAEPHVHAAPVAEGPPEPRPEHATAEETREAPAPTFGAAVMPSYELPNYTSHDVWGSISRKDQAHDVWVPSVMPHHDEQLEQREYEGAMPIPVPVPVHAGETSRQGNGNGNGSIRSVGTSFKMPNPHPEIVEDPFADPLPPIVISHSKDIYQSQPEISQQHPRMPTETHEDAHGIIMPLPLFNEVIPSNSVRQAPSQSSFGGGRANVETDERIPLLARPVTPNKQLNAFLQTSHAPTSHNYSSISPLASTSWNHHHNTSSQPRLHELGWLEYHLPDGTVYYVHPTRRTTTDANLRVERMLTAVEAWLDDKRDESLDVGVECWLREVKDVKKGSGAKIAMGRGGKKGEPAIYFERYWVDHHARTVIKAEDEDRRAIAYGRGHIHGNGAHGKGKQAGATAPKNDEDQLDMEYRFWSFMEAHPAHTALPHKAKTEAMDVLTWAWTDRLLPSYRPVPAPFTQGECQELMTLLRSFNSDHHDDHGIQTRVVARILLRVAHWRQIYFRPNKPLPKDVSTNPNLLPFQSRPFRRAIFDFLISCLCLGIPYIFLQRARLSSRVDEESGLLRGAGPMVIIGAATCLVAAIVLSASVTFLSLPGLDNVARTAGMVAVVFAAFAMAATGLAVVRHKADLERPVSHVAGIEGLMVISRRTVAMSLPLVLLSYSVIGFVAGIVIYSFRGGPISNPGSRNSFEDYIKWTVVGVVGGLAGILTTSMIVLRR